MPSQMNRQLNRQQMPVKTPKIPVSGANAGRFPVVLYSNVLCQGGKGGVSPDMEQLQNVYRTPIVITQINFMLECDNGGQDSGPFVGLQSLGPLIRVQLTKGRFELTQGHIPIQLFGPRYSVISEEFQNQNPGETGLANWFAYYKWVLPVPLVVGVGEAIVPNFIWSTPIGGLTASGSSRASAGSNSSILCHVSMIGQQVNITPGTRQQIPWVSAWVPTIGQNNSSDTNLMNRFNVPLHVQRLCQRTAYRVGFPNGSLEAWVANSSIDGSGNLNQFTMADTQGYDIVRDRTPFVDVIDQNRLAWTFNRVLEPRGRFKVTLLDSASLSYIPMMSIVGWREEEVG